MVRKKRRRFTKFFGVICYSVCLEGQVKNKEIAAADFVATIQ